MHLGQGAGDWKRKASGSAAGSGLPAPGLIRAAADPNVHTITVERARSRRETSEHAAAPTHGRSLNASRSARRPLFFFVARFSSNGPHTAR